jgi:hypothetical protein
MKGLRKYARGCIAFVLTVTIIISKLVLQCC